MGTVVLFTHPGPEHTVKGRGVRYPWNVRDQHRRKYLSVRAHVAEPDGEAFRRGAETQPVALWAEFEPPTTGTAFGGYATGGLPESWHTLLPVPFPPDLAQNTDPWIFGRSFRYGYCKQIHKDYLRHLRSGDLLLFGSYLKLDADGSPARAFHFFLDTVFVVARSHPLRRAEAIPEDLFDPVYRRAAYDRWPDNRDDCTFYQGAMLGDVPSAATFCYSPCAPYENGAPPRVRRPMISDLFGVEYGHGQVFATVPVPPDEAWRRVTERCLERGYALAVEVENAVIAPGSEDLAEPSGPGELVRKCPGQRRPGKC